TRPVDQPAVDFLAERIEPGVVLVPTGPLTNIGLLLARHPEAAERIERIVLMGGAIAEGNVTPAAESNIWADPEAARRVFSSGLDLSMVGLDVTHKALLSDVHAKRLAGTGPAGTLVADLHGFYARHHRRRHRGGGAPGHGAGAGAHGIHPGPVGRPQRGVRGGTGGELAGGGIGGEGWGSAGWRANCHVAVDIDAERFLALLIERIGALEGPR